MLSNVPTVALAEYPVELCPASKHVRADFNALFGNLGHHGALQALQLGQPDAKGAAMHQMQAGCNHVVLHGLNLNGIEQNMPAIVAVLADILLMLRNKMFVAGICGGAHFLALALAYESQSMVLQHGNWHSPDHQTSGSANDIQQLQHDISQALEWNKDQQAFFVHGDRRVFHLPEKAMPHALSESTTGPATYRFGIDLMSVPGINVHTSERGSASLFHSFQTLGMLHHPEISDPDRLAALYCRIHGINEHKAIKKITDTFTGIMKKSAYQHKQQAAENALNAWLHKIAMSG